MLVSVSPTLILPLSVLSWKIKKAKWWLMAGWLVLSTDGCDLLAWQISDQSRVWGAVTEWLCGCLPQRCRALMGHLSSTGTCSQVASETTETMNLGLLPIITPLFWNVSLWMCMHVGAYVHILSQVRWVLMASRVTHQPTRIAWQLHYGWAITTDHQCESMQLSKCSL